MSFKTVENEPGLVRDNNSHAILNTDSRAIMAARERKLKRKQEKEEILNLKKDVNDIKLMLTQIVEKLNGA
jgi:hypothetical protein